MGITNVQSQTNKTEETAQTKRKSQSSGDSASQKFSQILNNIAGTQMDSVVGDLSYIPDTKIAAPIEEKVEVAPQETEQAEEMVSEEPQVADEDTTVEPKEAKSEDTADQSQKGQTAQKVEKKEVVAEEQVVVQQTESQIKEQVQVATEENTQNQTNNAPIKFELNKQSTASSQEQQTKQAIPAEQQQVAQTAQTTQQTEATGKQQASIETAKQVTSTKSAVDDTKQSNANTAQSVLDDSDAAKNSIADDLKNIGLDKVKVTATTDGAVARNAQVAQASVSTVAETVSQNNGTHASDNSSKLQQTQVAGVTSTQAKTANKKTAETETTSTAQQQKDKIIEKLQEMMETATKSRNSNTMVVRLEPQELGQLTMKVTQRGDQVYARIIPESADVEATLRASATEITSVLSQAGFKTENVHISIGTDQNSSSQSQFSQMFSQQQSNGQFGSRNQSNMTRDFSGAEVRTTTTANNNVVAQGWVA